MGSARIRASFIDRARVLYEKRARSPCELFFGMVGWLFDGVHWLPRSCREPFGFNYGNADVHLAAVRATFAARNVWPKLLADFRHQGVDFS
jgi:hypothetical protein